MFEKEGCSQKWCKTATHYTFLEHQVLATSPYKKHIWNLAHRTVTSDDYEQYVAAKVG